MNKPTIIDINYISSMLNLTEEIHLNSVLYGDNLMFTNIPKDVVLNAINSASEDSTLLVNLLRDGGVVKTCINYKNCILTFENLDTIKDQILSYKSCKYSSIEGLMKDFESQYNEMSFLDKVSKKEIVININTFSLFRTIFIDKTINKEHYKYFDKDNPELSEGALSIKYCNTKFTLLYTGEYINDLFVEGNSDFCKNIRPCNSVSENISQDFTENYNLIINNLDKNLAIVKEFKGKYPSKKYYFHIPTYYMILKDSVDINFIREALGAEWFHNSIHANLFYHQVTNELPTIWSEDGLAALSIDFFGDSKKHVTIIDPSPKPLIRGCNTVCMSVPPTPDFSKEGNLIYDNWEYNEAQVIDFKNSIGGRFLFFQPT